ncbi:Permease of the drug/metabolite transporter superfamily protein [Rhodobacterales bacterium HTCC2150]|nr:Permease of the drug/metabolite transporter superfamily protein [Rhodobacterales bacterium HTCC2150] [Rhodobacteraceae bacterium HTCC2150]
MTRQLSFVDIIMGLSVALLWGMGLVFAKAALEHFPPVLLMTCRFIVTAGALVWFVRPPWGQMRALFLIALISAALQYSLTFTGLKGLDASITALVVQLEVPFLVIIGVVALGEVAGVRKWIGIAMAFIGVALISGEPKVASAWLSVLLVIGGAFTWAVGQEMTRALKDISGLTVTAWVAVFAVPQLAVVSLIFEENHIEAIRTAQPVVWGAVLYMGLIMTALGYGMWYTLVRKHPISLIAPFLLMLPVFAVLGGVFFLGEELGIRAILGGAIVIAGVAFILVERPKPETSLPD